MSLIDDIVRDGARRMLAAALEAEVAAYIDAHTDQLDEHGRRLVVRNGHAVGRARCSPPPARSRSGRRGSTTRRVESESTGERRKFASVILPALVPQVPEDHRGAAAAVPARPVQQGLRSRTGGVPRHGGGPVRRDDHPADHTVAGRRRAPSTNATCPMWTSSTCGPTASTSTSGSRRRGCACSSSSACAWTAPRSSLPWPTATASRPARGPT